MVLFLENFVLTKPLIKININGFTKLKIKLKDTLSSRDGMQ